MIYKYQPIAFQHGNDVIIKGIERFDFAETFDCGQAFRWEETSKNQWSSVAFGKEITIKKIKSDIILLNTTIEDYEKIWKKYFDIERNYNQIILCVSENEVIKKACEFAGGIRILRQEPWETLCSFIISQNNNIQRIKGIIERLCTQFGEKVGNKYAFPSAQRLSELSVEDLVPLRCGFRARYIIDAAKKVTCREVDLDDIEKLEIDSARKKLMNICGVGKKVADCTLLFGFGKIEAFPEDVWIKRIMSSLFSEGLPSKATPYAGIVQQYLFHYARTQKIK